MRYNNKKQAPYLSKLERMIFVKQGLKFILAVFVFLAAAGTAALLIIKYFDVLASLALDLKEKVMDKKRALFSTSCCAESDDLADFEDLDEEFEPAMEGPQE